MPELTSKPSKFAFRCRRAAFQHKEILSAFLDTMYYMTLKTALLYRVKIRLDDRNPNVPNKDTMLISVFTSPWLLLFMTCEVSNLLASPVRQIIRIIHVFF